MLPLPPVAEPVACLQLNESFAPLLLQQHIMAIYPDEPQQLYRTTALTSWQPT